MKTIKGGLPIRRGQVWEFQITLKRKAGSPDLDGKTVRLSLKDKADAAQPRTQITNLPNGRLTVEQTTDAIVFTGSLHSEVTALIPATISRLAFDVAFDTPAGPSRLFGGVVEVKW